MPEPLAGEDDESLNRQAIALNTEAIGLIKAYEDKIAPEQLPGEMLMLSRKLNENAQALVARELCSNAIRAAHDDGVRQGLERAEQAARAAEAAKAAGRHLHAIKGSA